MDAESQNHKAPLATVQRWMQAVIMHPDGIEAGIESPDAQQHLVLGSDECESVVAPSRNLTGLERLSIYHNAYFARLLECMRSIYPAVARTLGDEAFDALARGYLQAYPSRSYTLDRLGDKFAEFLDETRPDRDEAGEPTEEWPDFLLELARLEWAISEVFDGPGSENQHTLGAEDLLAVDPERWPELRLVAAPSLRTMAFRFPVNDYFTELRGLPLESDVPPLPSSSPSWLALSRRDFVVRRHELESSQYELLTALIAGQTVGDAILAIASSGDVASLDTLASQLRDWFRTWTAAGFFVAIEQMTD